MGFQRVGSLSLNKTSILRTEPQTIASIGFWPCFNKREYNENQIQRDIEQTNNDRHDVMEYNF